MKEYIEKEAVFQIIASQCGECADTCLEFDGIQPDCNQCLLHGAAKIIGTVPSSDVRPVRRGKWIVSRTDYGWNGAEFPTHCKCTECGREVPYQDKDNFCPNCGADCREPPKDE